MNNDKNSDSAEAGEVSNTQVLPGATVMADNVALDENAQYVAANPAQSIFSQISTNVIDKDVSLKEFFQRPVLIQDGTFSSTDTATSFPAISTVIRSTLNNRAMWKERLRGYHGFRADLKLTIRFNATPFQQGRYILFHVPTMGVTGADPKVLTHCFSISQILQLPHVEFDLSCETAAEFVIPYISDSAFFVVDQLGTSYAGASYYQGEVGVWGLRPYSPLATGTGGPTTCGYSIWANWINPEFFVSTIPQMGILDKEKKTAQVKPGVVTTTLTNVSKSMKILDEIPLLSTLAGPASWVASVLARAANVWGWSKPATSSMSGVMVRHGHVHHYNSDGAEYVNKAAIFAENRVDILPEMSSNPIDEMDISFLCSIPGYLGAISWTDSLASDAVLGTWNIRYDNFNTTNAAVGAGSVTTYNLAPVSFVARFFELGRGGLTFTFKIVKTPYHSGRLVAIFIPRTQNTTAATVTSLNSDNFAYPYKTVVDIREGNHFSITVPYVRPEPFASVGEVLGQLTLLVQEPLRRPTTAASAVGVLVEVKGAPDLTFGVESRSSYRPVVISANFQSGMIECNLYEGGVGNTVVKSVPAITAERIALGESVRSLRSLIRRWAFMRPVNANLTATAAPTTFSTPSATSYVFTPESYFVLFLSSTSFYNVDSTATTTTNMRFDFDPLTIMHTCFASSRGSYRYRFVTPFSGNGDAFLATSHEYAAAPSNRRIPVELAANTGDNLPLYGSVTGSGGYSLNPMSANDIAKTALNGEYTIETPPYTRYFARGLTKYYVYTDQTTPNANNGYGDYNIIKVQNYNGNVGGTATDTRVLAFKSVGEDFAFHNFVSLLPTTQ